MPSFFDTNILLYAVDEGEPEKLGIASTLVEEHLVEGDGMISVQVLREFYSASRKLSRPLSDEQAQEMVRYISTFRTLAEDAGMVLGAIRRGREYMLSFWEALIVEAALSAGANRLLSEDLQYGQEIHGLRVENPFLTLRKSSEKDRSWPS
ncbi:MAG: PIN domain-containing protein [Actinomycetota bacterium]|nr:PIN domain-containing protein [Actinomycetota bacterium]